MMRRHTKRITRRLSLYHSHLDHTTNYLLPQKTAALITSPTFQYTTTNLRDCAFIFTCAFSIFLSSRNSSIKLVSGEEHVFSSSSCLSLVGYVNVTFVIMPKNLAATLNTVNGSGQHQLKVPRDMFAWTFSTFVVKNFLRQVGQWLTTRFAAPQAFASCQHMSRG